MFPGTKPKKTLANEPRQMEKGAARSYGDTDFSIQIFVS